MKDTQLKSREQELREVYRYGFYDSPIYYKANLRIHTARISWICRNIGEYLEKLRPNTFDIEKLVALSIVHDDTEIIVGDIVWPVKMAFTHEEKAAYEQRCRDSIDILYKAYWNNFTDYDYRELLLMEDAWDSLEYAIMKYADKLEGHLEVYHELFAGNISFDKECKKKFGISTYDFSYNSSKEFLWQLLTRLWLTSKDIRGNPLLNIEQKITSEDILFKNWSFHTKESIQTQKWYYVYDAWVWLHFQYGSAEQIAYLYERVE